VRAWTQIYMAWIRQIRFAQIARESIAIWVIIFTEVEHMGERVVRLEHAIAEAGQAGSERVTGSISIRLTGNAPYRALSLSGNRLLRSWASSLALKALGS